jgi:hypothetical protein
VDGNRNYISIGGTTMSEEMRLTIEEIARVGLVVASDAIAEVLDMNEDELLIIGAYLADKLEQEKR